MDGDRHSGPDPPGAEQASEHGAGLVWRRSGTTWVGSWEGQPRAHVIRDPADPTRWIAYLKLGEPPGPSPLTTLPGRYATYERAQLAADEAWAAR